MSAVDPSPPIVQACEVYKSFRRETGETVHALAGVSLTVNRGTLSALVGPDGAGKTTLLRLAAGLIPPDRGQMAVLGEDVVRHPQHVQSRVAYMPQRFGLYEDLTVLENLNLYAALRGVMPAQREEQYPPLLEMTALGPFINRLAGRLSGGMKQKLGVACTLIGAPELLLLDEPTVGVDPLSRRELWAILVQLVQNGLTVLMSTSYLDEADRCGYVFVMHQGRALSHGEPSTVAGLAVGHTFLAVPPPGQKARELQARLLDHPTVIDAVPEGGQVRLVQMQNDPIEPGVVAHPTSSRFEDGFMMLIRQAAATEHQPASSGTGSGPGANLFPPPVSRPQNGEAVVLVRDLVRQFGTFTAVDHVSFEVQRGEMFGLLGPNGAGKTTTFRMLCGLLPASGGKLSVAGVDVRHARASARQRIGYVAQKFSLYGQLSVRDNLGFFASAYGLGGRRKRERITWAMDQFELGDFARLPSGQLPGGYKQRLAMAAALLHEPEILFLDEPTSGADPLARREFWQRITALSAQGVTVIVTTHFMEEAEYCDHAVILDSGRVLAQGSPADIRRRGRPVNGRAPNMEDAFVAIVEEARQGRSAAACTGDRA